MAVVLKNDEVFIHLPKTGGTWVKEVLYNLDLVKEELGDHAYISDLPDKYKDSLKFGFVRNPLEWYKSYWSFYKTMGRLPKVPFSEIRYKYEGPDDFNRFVNEILNKYPSFLTKFFKLFIGNDLSGLDVYGKQESLSDGLILILRGFGYEIDSSIVHNTMKRNISYFQKPNYTIITNTRVKSEESELFNKFIY